MQRASGGDLGRRPVAFVRLLLGLASFAAALLAVLPAPTTALWMLAVAVTEWGHLLALLALLALLPGWRRSRAGRAGGIFGLAAALLALSPLLRALPVARDLPARLVATFGDTPPRSLPGAPARPSPLALADLFRGIATPQGQPERRVYAERAGQPLVVDLYRPPPAAAPAPAVLVIHGGSWQSGDPTQFAEFSQYLAARGYLVAAISYRLAPDHPFPAARDDVATAIVYLRQHSAELGLDPQRLALLGRSAGGQLALLAAYSSRDPGIRGVVAFYPPADLRYGYDHPGNPWVIDGRGTLVSYLGGSPATTPAAYDAASPIGFASVSSPPTLLIHGTRDELVSVVQSERLAEKLRLAGRPHLLLRLPWATHACDYNLSGPSGQLSAYAVERFLAAVMR